MQNPKEQPQSEKSEETNLIVLSNLSSEAQIQKTLLNTLKGAITRGDIDVVNKLKGVITDLRMKNQTELIRKSALIHHAVNYKTKAHIEILRILLESMRVFFESGFMDINEYQIDVNEEYHYKIAHTPLILAIFNDNIEAVKLLILYGADPNLPQIKDNQHLPPLHVSFASKTPDLLKILLETKKIKLGALAGGDTGPLVLLTHDNDITNLEKAQTFIELLVEAHLDIKFGIQFKADPKPTDAPPSHQVSDPRELLLNQKDIDRALAAAIKKGWDNVVYFLSKVNPTPNYVIDDKKISTINATALTIAIEKFNPTIANKLIERHWDVNHRYGPSLKTPIFQAVLDGHLPSVTLLLKHKADLSICDKNCLSIFTVAVLTQNKNKEILNALLIASKETLKPLTFSQFTSEAFAIAANCSEKECKENLEYMKLLLTYKINVNFLCLTTPKSALMTAAEKNNVVMIEWLLSLKGQIEINFVVEPLQRWPALFFALKNGHVEAAKLLLAAGADETYISSDKQTSGILLTPYMKDPKEYAELANLIFKRFINKINSHFPKRFAPFPYSLTLLTYILDFLGAKIETNGDMLIPTHSLNVNKRNNNFFNKYNKLNNLKLNNASFPEMIEKAVAWPTKPKINEFQDLILNSSEEMQKYTADFNKSKDFIEQKKIMDSHFTELVSLPNNLHNIISLIEKIDKEIFDYNDSIQVDLKETNQILLSTTFANTRKEKQKATLLETNKRRFEESRLIMQSSIEYLKKTKELYADFNEKYRKDNSYALAHLKLNELNPAQTILKSLLLLVNEIHSHCKALTELRNKSETIAKLCAEQKDECAILAKAAVQLDNKHKKELEDFLKVLAEQKHKEEERRKQLLDAAEKEAKEKLAREAQKKKWKEELAQYKKEKEAKLLLLKEKLNKESNDKSLKSKNLLLTNYNSDRNTVTHKDTHKNLISINSSNVMSTQYEKTEEANYRKPHSNNISSNLNALIAWPIILQKDIDKEYETLQKVLHQLDYSTKIGKGNIEEIIIEKYALLGLTARIMEILKRNLHNSVISAKDAEKFRDVVFHADDLFQPISSDNLKITIEQNCCIKDLALKLLSLLQSNSKTPIQSSLLKKILEYKFKDSASIYTQVILDKLEKTLEQLNHYKLGDGYYKNSEALRIAIGFIYAQLGCFATTLKKIDFLTYQTLCHNGKAYELYRALGRNFRHVRINNKLIATAPETNRNSISPTLTNPIIKPSTLLDSAAVVATSTAVIPATASSKPNDTNFTL